MTVWRRGFVNSGQQSWPPLIRMFGLSPKGCNLLVGRDEQIQVGIKHAAQNQND
jgi:hypothetical protein